MLETLANDGSFVRIDLISGSLKGELEPGLAATGFPEYSRSSQWCGMKYLPTRGSMRDRDRAVKSPSLACEVRLDPPIPS
jgi:hypothetical protein